MSDDSLQRPGEGSQQSATVAAQVALYSLRQPLLAPAIDAAVRTFHECGLNVQSGPMSTLVVGGGGPVFQALEQAFAAAAGQGETVMVVTLSNACPVPPGPAEALSFRAVGHVENDFDEPTSSDTLRAAVSRLVIDPVLAQGLTGLEPGGKVMVVFHFHRSREYDLLQHPRGDRARPKRGVFALHSPHRPNPIGVTVADLLSVEGNVLEVGGLDALNGSPVLDLKSA